METIVEKDSPATALCLLGAICSLLLAGVFGLAYMGGVFTGKDDVAENDKRITQLNLLKMTPMTAPKH